MSADGQEAIQPVEGQSTSDRLLGFLLVVAATMCWSTSGIFINLISDGSQLTPVSLAFTRDLATFLMLALGLALLKPELLKVKRADLPWLAAMGALSIAAFHVLWNTSVLMNGVSISTVIQCNAPVFVTIMAWLIWREPLSMVKLLAILLAFIGIVLISRLDQLGDMQITLLGLAIALGSAVLYGSFSLFGKKLAGSYSTWTILTYVFGFAALTLAPFQLLQQNPFPLSNTAVGSFVGLVLLTTIIGFGLYTSGLRRLQASVASITSNSEVAFAALLSYLLLGERLDAWQIVGAILVVGGVSLLSLPGLRARRERQRQAKLNPGS